MKTVHVDNLKVVWPYSRIYPEQIEFMEQIKLSLDAKGTSILQIPPGLGKNVSLFAVLLEYMNQNREFGPLVFCCESYQSYLSAYNDYEKVYHARMKFPSDFDYSISSITISSRNRMCINQDIRNSDDIEDLCLSKSEGWSESPCKMEKLTSIPDDYPIDHLSMHGFIDYCKSKNACPYYSSRNLFSSFNVIFMADTTLLDPREGKRFRESFPEKTILVFDSGQNLDIQCNKVMSYSIGVEDLDVALRALEMIKLKSDELRYSNELKASYEDLKNGVTPEKVASYFLPNYPLFSLPILHCHLYEGIIPGSVWEMNYFHARAKSFISYLKYRIFKNKTDDKVNFSSVEILSGIFQELFIEPESLYFFGPRLLHFIAFYKLPITKDCLSLVRVFDFASVLSMYDERINIQFHNTQQSTEKDPKGVIQLIFLDSSSVFDQISSRFFYSLITSNVMPSQGIYEQILGFKPTTMMTIDYKPARDHLLPIIISHGTDQATLDLNVSDIKSNLSISRNYNILLIELTKVCPDGIVAFFPSHAFIDSFVNMWDNTSHNEELLQRKLIFIETHDPREATFTVDNFFKACDNGRGAILMAVYGGPICQSINLGGHRARSVLLFGLIVDERMHPSLEKEAEFLEMKIQFPRDDFVSFNAVRSSIQCISSILSSKSDYSSLLLVDCKYSFPQYKEKLPTWITKILMNEMINQGVEDALEKLKLYYCNNAQEFVPNEGSIIDL